MAGFVNARMALHRGEGPDHVLGHLHRNRSNLHGRPAIRATAVLILLVLLGLAATGLSACSSSGPSAAAVCHVWDTQGLAIHNQVQKESGSADGLGALMELIALPSQMANLMGAMGEVAPQPIQSDFYTLQSSLNQEVSQAGSDALDPIGGLVSGFASALANEGDYQAVTEYLTKNCGSPSMKAR